MTNIKLLPKHLRPRDKLIEKGAENLKDKELLAILLRTGREGKSALDIAEAILHKFPKEKLLHMTYQDMVKISGVNAGKACTVLAAFELAKRAIGSFDSNVPVIKSPKDVVAHLSDLLQVKKEHFVVFYLNARKQLLHKETISVGTLNASLVHPREVFEPALRFLATSLVLAHNHPSGCADPSEEDIMITDKLVHAGEIIGIDVCDHVIFTKDDFCSLRSLGKL